MKVETNKEFQERRQKGNDNILKQDFLPYKRFISLDTMAYTDGEIPIKYKELMGLTASAVLRCNDCIHYHIAQAINAGASMKELNEALNIALIVGGSIVIPHLRYALSAADEIFEISKLRLEVISSEVDNEQ